MKPAIVHAMVKAICAIPVIEKPRTRPLPARCATTNGTASTQGVYLVEQASPVANPASA